MTEEKTLSDSATKNDVNHACELIGHYQALVLICCTVVFYIFSYIFLSTFLGDLSLGMQDIHFYSICNQVMSYFIGLLN